MRKNAKLLPGCQAKWLDAGCTSVPPAPPLEEAGDLPHKFHLPGTIGGNNDNETISVSGGARTGHRIVLGIAFASAATGEHHVSHFRRAGRAAQFHRGREGTSQLPV